MVVRSSILVLLIGVSLLSGCGSSGDTSTISKSDVTDLPHGNASGTSFSGTYKIETSTLVGCNCRSGPCSGIHSSTGHELVVTQTDGTLEIVENKTDDYRGGINQDGKFWCGVDASTSSTALFFRWQGTAVVAKSLDVVSNITVVGTLDGQYYDCDAEAHFQAPYLGP